MNGPVGYSKILEQVLKCVSSLIDASSNAPTNLSGDSKMKDYLDSFNLIRLVTLLENECGVVFEYSDLNESNWMTPSTVAELIGEKRKAAVQSSSSL